MSLKVDVFVIKKGGKGGRPWPIIPRRTKCHTWVRKEGGADERWVFLGGRVRSVYREGEGKKYRSANVEILKGTAIWSVKGEGEGKKEE